MDSTNTVPFCMPIDKIIENYSLYTTPDCSGRDPVVLVWKQPHAGMQSCVVCKAELPRTLQDVLLETSPALIVNMEVETTGRLFSLLSDWGGNGKLLAAADAAEIWKVRQNLANQAKEDLKLQVTNKAAWETRSLRSYEYACNTRTKWTIYFTEPYADTLHLHERWSRMLWARLCEMKNVGRGPPVEVELPAAAI